jgi:hypothetical protein
MQSAISVTKRKAALIRCCYVSLRLARESQVACEMLRPARLLHFEAELLSFRGLDRRKSPTDLSLRRSNIAWVGAEFCRIVTLATLKPDAKFCRKE